MQNKQRARRLSKSGGEQRKQPRHDRRLPITQLSQVLGLGQLAKRVGADAPQIVHKPCQQNEGARYNRQLSRISGERIFIAHPLNVERVC